METPLQPVITEEPLVGAGALLKQSWYIYKQNLRVFLRILVPVFIVLGINFVTGLLLVFFVLPAAIADIIFVLTGIAEFVLSLWLGVSILYLLKEPQLSGGEALRKGWSKKIVSYWWILIVSGFITLGGLLLFVVPGILLVIWFSFALYVLVDEDLKGMNALMRSKQLVAKHWGGVLWRFLVLALVEVLVILPIFLVIGGLFVVSIFAFNFSFAEIEELSILAEPIAALVQWVIILFGTAFGFLLYKDLKRIKGNPAYIEPTKSSKMKYVAIGILGLLLPIIVGVAILTISIVNSIPEGFLEPESVTIDLNI